MLIAACPRCGSPTRVAVQQPDELVCHHCDYRGPPEENVQQQLRQAAQSLGNLELRSRQLTGAQRKLLSRERSLLFRLFSLFVVALVPLALCGGCGLIFSFGRRSYPVFSVMCAAPVIFFVVFASALLAFRIRYRRKLEFACAAIPPRQAGEPAGCHVCGAPLPAPEVTASKARDDAFVRCDYCAADNLVAPDVLRRMSGRSERIINDLAQEVRKEGTRLSLVSGLGTSAMVLLALVAPLTCCLLAYLIPQWLWTIEQPYNTTDEYLLVDSHEGYCIARVSRRWSDGTAHLILFGHREHDRNSNYVAGAGTKETFSAKEIVGSEALYREKRERHPGTVLRVYKAPLDASNRAVLSTGTGGIHRGQIEGLCYERAPEGLSVVPWPKQSRIPRDAHLLE